MPYWRLFYHFIWGTKGRAPMISQAIRDDLYRVMVGKAQELGGFLYAVGGMPDHVHMAVSVPPALSLADFVGQIKGTSTHAVNHLLQPTGQFQWQAEYGVVSFGGKQLDIVVKYVLEQRQHHEQGSTIALLERQTPPVTQARTTLKGSC